MVDVVGGSVMVDVVGGGSSGRASESFNSGGRRVGRPGRGGSSGQKGWLR